MNAKARLRKLGKDKAMAHRVLLRRKTLVILAVLVCLILLLRVLHGGREINVASPTKTIMARKCGTLIDEQRLHFRTRDPMSGYPISSSEELLALPALPAFMGCTSAPQAHDQFIEFRVMISPASGVIYVSPTAPFEVVYQKQHNRVVGGVWKRHHEQFAAYVGQHMGKHKRIVEVGGGHGHLAQLFLREHEDCEWTIVEPNPLVDENPPQLRVWKGVIEDYMKDNSARLSSVLLVHSHLVEHVPSPHDFISSFGNAMGEGSMMVFSMPNLKGLLQRGFSALHVEHTVMLAPEHVEWLLGKAGFEVVEKKDFEEPHAVFYAAKKVSKRSSGNIPNIYNGMKRSFMAWKNHLQADVAEINRIISNPRKLHYIFSGHVFTQMLISAGVADDRFVAVLDNDSSKHGLRLYGTSLQVIPPSDVLQNPPEEVVVIVRAGPYSTEIVRGFMQICPDCTVKCFQCAITEP